MPALARLGYRYDEASQLPVWLFWALSTSDNKDVTKRQTLEYEASALSFGSFDKATRKEIRNRWHKTITAGHSKEPVPIEKRKQEWAEMAKWF